MGLAEYRKKRNFKRTAEPRGVHKRSARKPIFVVQEHHASHLHYDFRLEMGGVLKSWAVPKGVSTDPKVKRLAVEVEDHPLEYASFAGEIPKGEYGAGRVYIWDHGTWSGSQNPASDLKKGRLEFELQGHKLHGRWILVRTGKATGRKPQWLLIKRTDSFAQPKATLNFVEPQLATLSSRVPTGEDWIHEIKFDGYRTLLSKNQTTIHLWTRSGLDWTEKYPALAQEAQSLQAQDCLIDGEYVWLDENGRSDFGLLQKALQDGLTDRLIYYAFDLLSLEGRDLRELPLVERKKRLRQLLKQSDLHRIIFSEHWDKQADRLLEQSCKLGLEGVISKQARSPYVSGRARNWLKSKCSGREEFVVGGFTPPQGSRAGFGALLLGSYDSDGKFVYRGRVGTGFDDRTLRALTKQLSQIEQRKSPFEVRSPREKGIRWTRPEVLVEVRFSGWTQDRVLRHASFLGLREDKPARQVEGESDVVLSHPDKILFSKAKLTKQMMADYYEQVASYMLPYVADRPLSLLRCPNGEGKGCFFQKHLDHPLPGVITRAIESAEGPQDLMTIDSAKGLKGLVQSGTLELHVWQTHVAHFDFPDQIVFDLDPHESVRWAEVKKAAFEIKDLLTELKLPAFVKVTGGKGLHIHVPIEPRYPWSQVKSFSEAVVRMMAQRDPKRFLTTSSKAKRVGRIFLDYLRNGFGATAVAPYSLRAKPHAPVAMPITWDELRTLRAPDTWSVTKVLTAIKAGRRDPWKGFDRKRTRIRILDQSQPATS